MKTPQEIFKEEYSHAFDINKSFELAFEECATTVAEIYAEQFKIKWISVKDRLPEEGSHVLIPSIDCHYGTYSIREGSSFYYIDDEGVYCKLTDVDFWMPFPEFP